MTAARLESYRQGFGADVFVWNANAQRIEVVVSWGLLEPCRTIASELKGDSKIRLRQWEGLSVDQAMRALGYDHLIVPPWIAALVQNADEIR